MMKTVIKEFTNYVTESIYIGRGSELIAYTFKNKFKARVIEMIDTNLFALVEIDPRDDKRYFFFDLTRDEVFTMLKNIKNK
ncbi:hypothetical protein B0U03_02480 [Listeria monocytogenes]|nr:hypothetical protein [Listeria monocytogenes]EAE9689148.1 hypothetical protein [Listeria monocytogenes]EAE9692209.1 hypothetical protein [Listeria monocytogenes]EAE9694159.1 hypothetical protein [Listeria monocytogenes]EAE9697708.1 hypothetical protein [Listeria monocytogenes]